MPELAPRSPAPRALTHVWLRCSLLGGVLADRWFSVVHGRTVSWVVFR
jgi:hypothetical protein